MTTPPQQLPTVALIIPCYNPRHDWANAFSEAINKIVSRDNTYTWKFVLVNDGSQKGIMPQEIEGLKNTVPNFHFLSYIKNKGKGYALRKGLRHANADYYIYTDIDFPYTQESLIKILTNLTMGADVCLGYRQPNYYNHVPAFRKWLSKSFRHFLRNGLRLKTDDTQCGLKGFNEKGRELFLQTKTHGFLFDLEFVVLASRNKQLEVVPVNVTLKPNIQFSKMSLTLLIKELKSLFVILHRII